MKLRYILISLLLVLCLTASAEQFTILHIGTTPRGTTIAEDVDGNMTFQDASTGPLTLEDVYEGYWDNALTDNYFTDDESVVRIYYGPGVERLWSTTVTATVSETTTTIITPSGGTITNDSSNMRIYDADGVYASVNDLTRIQLKPSAEAIGLYTTDTMGFYGSDGSLSVKNFSLDQNYTTFSKTVLFLDTSDFRSGFESTTSTHSSTATFSSGLTIGSASTKAKFMDTHGMNFVSNNIMSFYDESNNLILSIDPSTTSAPISAYGVLKVLHDNGLYIGDGHIWIPDGGSNLTFQDATTGPFTLAQLASGIGSGSGVTDHGALTGLTDDDHTIYILADGTRAFTGTTSQPLGAEISTATLTGNLTASSGGTIGSDSGIMQFTDADGLHLNATTVTMNEYLAHHGDLDTYIRYQTDQITVFAGDKSMIDIVEAGTDYIDLIEGDVRITDGGYVGTSGDSDILLFQDNHLTVAGTTVTLHTGATIVSDSGITQITDADGFHLNATTTTINEYLAHYGDLDTCIRFQTDQVTLQVGGVAMIDAVEAETDYVGFTGGIRITDGGYIGLDTDTDLLSLASGALTVSGELSCTGTVTFASDGTISDSNNVMLISDTDGVKIQQGASNYISITASAIDICAYGAGDDVNIKAVDDITLYAANVYTSSTLHVGVDDDEDDTIYLGPFTFVWDEAGGRMLATNPEGTNTYIIIDNNLVHLRTDTAGGDILLQANDDITNTLGDEYTVTDSDGDVLFKVDAVTSDTYVYGVLYTQSGAAQYNNGGVNYLVDADGHNIRVGASNYIEILPGAISLCSAGAGDDLIIRVADNYIIEDSSGTELIFADLPTKKWYNYGYTYLRNDYGLYIGDNDEAHIWVANGDNELQFQDGTTGPFTLSELIAGGGGGGVTDHGALTGLTDDDHPIYTLVDGSRAFTGTVTLASGGTLADNSGETQITDDSIHMNSTTVKFNQYLEHYADADTGIEFNVDRITLRAGNIVMLDIVEDTTDYIDFIAGDIRITDGGYIGTSANYDIAQVSASGFSVTENIIMSADKKITIPQSTDGAFHVVIPASSYNYKTDNIIYDTTNLWLDNVCDTADVVHFDFNVPHKQFGSSVVLDSVVVVYYRTDDSADIASAYLYRVDGNGAKNTVGSSTGFTTTASWAEQELLSANHTMVVGDAYTLVVTFNNSVAGHESRVSMIKVQYHTE